MFDLPPPAIITYMGILSPECQMQREIAAIKCDPRLVEKLGDQCILEIVPIEGGYIVKTDLCDLQIDVKYLPPLHPELIGEPQRFELKFHDPIY
jgi:hypothetical protein